MADNNELLARSVFDTLCAALDSDNWKYQKDEENLEIKTGAQGDDLPMDLYIRVKAKNGVVSLISPLPVKVPEDKRVDLAVAMSVANDRMRWGNFDYDIQDGSIFYRMVACFIDSLLGPELFKAMVYMAANTIDKYNDRFLMLAKGIIDFEKFLELENQ